jgi:hypothetical protein
LERLKGETSTLPGASAETLGKDSHSDDELRELLKLRNVALVGISRDPAKPAHFVPKYPKEHVFHIIPVNPFAEETIGLKCYKSFPDLNEPVNIVNIFRPSGV